LDNIINQDEILNNTNNIYTISKNNINNIKNNKNMKILNKPLKEKEIFKKEKNIINNNNIELILIIILGIKKCISYLDNYNFLLINNNKNIIKENILSLISNYPFKKNKYIFEQNNTFSYSFYTINKKMKIY